MAMRAHPTDSTTTKPDRVTTMTAYIRHTGMNQ
jgi:hypothetical protein